MVKVGLVGVTAGALVGTGYSIHQLNQPRGHIVNEESTIPILEEIPKIEPTRRVNITDVFTIFTYLKPIMSSLFSIVIKHTY